MVGTLMLPAVMLGKMDASTMRSPLIVEIDAGESNAELYAEVQAAIEILNVVENVV